jgi:hypothetical protein
VPPFLPVWHDDSRPSRRRSQSRAAGPPRPRPGRVTGTVTRHNRPLSHAGRGAMIPSRLTVAARRRPAPGPDSDAMTVNPPAMISLT